MELKSFYLDFSDKEYFKKIKEKKFYVNHKHWDGAIPSQDTFDYYEKKGIKLKTCPLTSFFKKWFLSQ